jgi:RNA-binding protein
VNQQESGFVADRELQLVWDVIVSGVLAADPNSTGGYDMVDIPSSIKRQAMDRDFQPSVRIGKTGVTENIIEEIRGQLIKRKLVKIKINKGIYERNDRAIVWNHLAEETSSVLVLARGNVGVLWFK